MRRGERQNIIEGEVNAPASAAVQAIGEAARARHPGTRAVLFYGSCLRSGSDEGGLVDLYLLVEDYGRAYGNRLAATANRILPPNVYYLDIEFEGRMVRAKYAVVSLAQLERLVTERAFHSYFWARFAQPTGLLWSAGAPERERATALLARAVETLARETLPLFNEAPPPRDLFVRAFSETYATELRAEGASRAAELVDRYIERYEALGRLLLEELPAPDQKGRRKALRRWHGRRLVGKLLSIARLTKAGFTFAGGQDYLLWKIRRHSGVHVEPRPWERRHPLLSAPLLAWRVYRRGGFR